MIGQNDILTVIQNGVTAVNNLNSRLSSISGSSSGPVPISGSRHQRSVTVGPVVIASSDSILNLNLGSSTNIPLPVAATRSGDPLTFKDVGSQAFANHITLSPNGAELIDGSTSFIMTNNRQAITLYPFDDGVNTGWFIT